MYDCSWTFRCDRSTACPFLGKKLPGFQLLSNKFLGWSSFVQHPFLDLSELLRFFRPWISLNFCHWWAKPMSWLKRWASFWKGGYHLVQFGLKCDRDSCCDSPIGHSLNPAFQSKITLSIECPLLLVSVSFEHPANTSARLVVIIVFGIKAKTGLLPEISAPTRLSLADDLDMVAFQRKNLT